MARLRRSLLLPRRSVSVVVSSSVAALSVLMSTCLASAEVNGHIPDRSSGRGIVLPDKVKASSQVYLMDRL
jgi:hypothetical protein